MADIQLSDLKTGDASQKYETGPSGAGLGRSEEIKVDSKGNVLRPTPSDNPRDPLNWPLWKKRMTKQQTDGT
jgi:hypothetical protein